MITDIKLTLEGFTNPQPKRYLIDFYVTFWENAAVVLERDIQGELSVHTEGVMDQAALDDLNVNSLQPQLRALRDEYEQNDFIRKSTALAAVADAAAAAVKAERR